jgi:hypothetical protein
MTCGGPGVWENFVISYAFIVNVFAKCRQAGQGPEKLRKSSQRTEIKNENEKVGDEK